MENYLFDTLTSFIAINCALFITKDNWKKLNPKKNGFIKRNIFKLSWCLIPFFRWFMVFFILVIGIALGNKKFKDKIEEKQKENEDGR